MRRYTLTNAIVFDEAGDEYDLPLKRSTIGKASKAARKRGLWQLAKSEGQWHVYVTCFICGQINDITRHSLSNEGSAGSTCVVCRNGKCRAHFFPKLMGWSEKERRKVRDNGF